VILTYFFCSFTQAASEPVGGRNGVIVFSAVQHGEAFHELGVQISQSLILIDAVSSACWDKKEKKKKKKK
jgi:hypothetical protein